MNKLSPIGVLCYIDNQNRHDVSAYYGSNRYGEHGRYLDAIQRWFAIDKSYVISYKFRYSEVYETT
jgi:hypothetical protein